MPNVILKEPKICSDCQKPQTVFPLTNGRIGIRCLDCRKIYYKKRYHENKERMKDVRTVYRSTQKDILDSRNRKKHLEIKMALLHTLVFQLNEEDQTIFRKRYSDGKADYPLLFIIRRMGKDAVQSAINITKKRLESIYYQL